MCWPLLRPPSVSISLLLLSVLGPFWPLPSSSVKIPPFCPPGFPPLPHLPLLFLCLLPLAACFLFSLLWISAAVSPNSNSLGVSVGTSIFLTSFFVFLGPILQSNKCSNLKKAYQQAGKSYICTLNQSLFAKTKRLSQHFQLASISVENQHDFAHQLAFYRYRSHNNKQTVGEMKPAGPTHFPADLSL